MEILKTHGVIPIHGAFELQGEDEIQILAAPGYECASPLRGSDLEAVIEFGDVMLAQESVGPDQGVDARKRSSCGNRPCQVPKLRSLRPRAWGE